VYKHINPENADVIIEAVKGKTKREVERFVASLQPVSIMPPARVRPFVVPVPTCAKSTITGDGEKHPARTEEVTSNDRSDVQKSMPVQLEEVISNDASDVRNSMPVQREALELKRMLHVELNMPEERMQKLDRIRSLASHRLRSNASLDDVIDFMADYFLKREDPAQREKRRQERVANKKEAKDAAGTAAAVSKKDPEDRGGYQRQGPGA
jgi:hypothetical protein